MSQPPAPHGPQVAPPHRPGRYEIRLENHLDARWSTWFDGLDLSRQSDGTTVLRGPVVDQDAPHGLLQYVRDVGLPLISLMSLGLGPGPDDC